MTHRNLLSVLVLAMAAAFCWQAAQSASTDAEDEELYRLFVDALENVDRNYVRGVERRDLIESAINGMLEGLDPYSNFIGPKDKRMFEQHTKGKFTGVGIQIGTNERAGGAVIVVSPLTGSPAYEAGILPGDLILKIKDEKKAKAEIVKGLTLSQVVERILGPPGSKVTLTIRHRPYDEDPIDVTLTRAVIKLQSILGYSHGPDDQWTFMVDEENEIAYMRISSFMVNTRKDLEKILRELVEEGMQALILDLRFNPGGLLRSSVEVSDLFVEEGMIVSTSGRTTRDQKYVARKPGTLSDFPMVVLVNRASASASEIVSACLQDHERAIIVGERTWGKGSVQNVIELEGGKSALKLTTASYLRPNGHNIHRFKDSSEEDEWGVRPNEGYEVKFSDEEMQLYSLWRHMSDLVMGKASEVEKARKKSKKKDAKNANSKEDSEQDEEKPFEDRQLAKALEYLHEELGVLQADRTKADSKESDEEPATATADEKVVE